MSRIISSRPESCNSDQEFAYMDGLYRKTVHRIRLYDNGAWITMLITDMSHKHICNSVTNSIKDLMTAFIMEHPEIPRQRLVIIEHYEDLPETFDLVTLQYDERSGRFYHPEWKSITKQQAEDWIGTVLEESKTTMRNRTRPTIGG